MANRILLVALLLITSRVSAEGWGSLKAQFFYDGPPPKPALIVGAPGPPRVSDGLTIGPKNELANVLVYMLQSPDDKIPIHKDFAAAAETPITFDNVNSCFVPKVFTLLPGQKVLVGNKDKAGFNANFCMFQNPVFNPLISVGEVVEHKFDKAERAPTPIICNTHFWMQATVMVNANPYTAVSDAVGVINIEKVPAGVWAFMIWHGKPVTHAKQNGVIARWKKGRATAIILDGQTTDWGKIEFEATPQ